MVKEHKIKWLRKSTRKLQEFKKICFAFLMDMLKKVAHNKMVKESTRMSF